MKAISFFVFASLSALFSSPVSAQCPAGTPSAGNPQCIPPSAWPQNAPSQQAAAEPKWKLTWGAIAIDPNTGDVGTAVGSFSKRKAEREAIARCSANGAGDCKKILFAYENQCGVVAWPSAPGKSGGIIAQSGPTVAVASEVALKRCAGDGRSDSGVCEIVYSDCTKPVLIR
ncbi:DUF4189 domain-containing protein [Lysobacter sp. CA196]|uniref:DUF4189 domain-containing protein n=1 Tax=Lysobacter sp. CA196 TaxID=3455606 RepID=UPI003F8D6738